MRLQRSPVRSHVYSTTRTLRRASKRRPCGGGAVQEQGTVARVPRECGCALELGAGFVLAAKFQQQIRPDRGQQMVVLQRRFVYQRIGNLEPRRGSERHSDRYCPVEFDDRRGRDFGERVVERGNALPISLPGSRRPRVAGRDRGLQRVRAQRTAKALGALQRTQTAMNQELIPPRTILIEQ